MLGAISARSGRPISARSGARLYLVAKSSAIFCCALSVSGVVASAPSAPVTSEPTAVDDGTVLLEPGSILQISLGTIVCATYLMMQLQANPYINRFDELVISAIKLVTVSSTLLLRHRSLSS